MGDKEKFSGLNREPDRQEKEECVCPYCGKDCFSKNKRLCAALKEEDQRAEEG